MGEPKPVWIPPSQRAGAEKPVLQLEKEKEKVEEVKALETVSGPRSHVITIIKMTDPVQKYAFLANCTCQFQGRAKTAVEIQTVAQRHFERQE